MHNVLALKKQYECMKLRHDPMYTDQVRACEIVKEFIIKYKLIVYGGTAIDYVLRLHGDKIYPDDVLAIPDLDFYSPTNVDHAYMLADILYKEGWEESRAINALHMLTMKVDIGSNHFIADISYVPPSIYNYLPTIEYNGMRCIHPDYQRIDSHSALSFPYDSPPREVVFARWEKDIKRFNLLNLYYPITTPDVTPIVLRSITALGVRQYVLGGFAAYAAIYTFYKNHNGALSKDIVPALLDVKTVVHDGKERTQITFDTLDQKIELMHMHPEKCMGELKQTAYKKFRPLVNMLPPRVESKDYTVYSTHNKLLAVNSITIDNIVFRVTNVQYLMKHFLSLYHLATIEKHPQLASLYVRRYISLLTMCKLNLGPLALSQTTYGSENIEHSFEVLLNQIYVDLGKAQPFYAPTNYNVAKAKDHGHPNFIPEDCKFFQIDGAEYQ